MDQNILYFKLVTGENLISSVDGEDDEGLLLVNPLQLFSRHTNFGSSVKISKWIPFVNEQEFFLRRNHIVTFGIPTNDIVDFYNEALESLENTQSREYEEEITRALYEKFANTNIMVH